MAYRQVGPPNHDGRPGRKSVRHISVCAKWSRWAILIPTMYVFSTGSQNVYLFLGHISHMGHVCLAAGSSPFVLAPHRFTCLSVCQHTSVHITPLDRVEGSSGDGLQRPRLKHYFCRTKSNSSLSEWLHRIIEDKTFWSQRNAESTSFFD